MFKRRFSLAFSDYSFNNTVKYACKIQVGELPYRLIM